MNNQWMEDPILSEISNEKLEILTKIIGNSKGMKPQEMLTYFMKESGQASKNGIQFSDQETDAILKVLTEDMSEADKKRVETIRRMVQLLSKTGKGLH